jgi:diguanylate cyclase (GGDEF)-like protein
MRFLVFSIFFFHFITVTAQDNLSQPVSQIESHTDSAQRYLDIADRAYETKHYDEAIKYYLIVSELLTAPDPVTMKSLAVIYKYLAQSYKRVDDKKATVFYYEKTLEIFTKLNDKKNIARTLNTLAEAERKLENYEASLEHSLQSIELHKEINDIEGKAKALVGAGIIYRYIGDYEKSLTYISQAYRYYKTRNMVSDMAKASNQMGLIYTRLKQFEDARSFYQLTIDLPQDKVEAETLASALREIAVIDINAGHYDIAKINAQRAYDIYIRIGHKANQSLITRIIGNIYREELNYTQAINYYRKSLEIAQAIGSKLYQVKAQTPLAAMLFESNMDESIRLLKTALDISTEINNNAQKLYAYRELRKAETLRENYAAALEYAVNEILYTDIINKENEEQQLVQLKAKLYSEKLQMEVISLREKASLNQLELARKNDEIELAKRNNTIAELKLENNKYASMVLGLLLTLSVLVIIMIYLRFKASTKRNIELNDLATRDPLTNCFNRRALLSHMEADFNHVSGNQKYSIVMIDIDHFKDINDHHGHLIGDTILCKVAQALQTCLDSKHMLARFGGEEFCVVLNDTTESEALSIAEKMRDNVAQIHYDNISVTCSFGVASMDHQTQKPTELISRADNALYQSKSMGRNLVSVWEPSITHQDISS